MGVRITDLPERLQKYALKQMRGGSMSKQSKYKNIKTEANGIKFDSKKEAQRYAELMAELRSGDIRNLRLQQTFTLQEAYTTYTGERVRAIRYVADFAYERCVDGEWLEIVEDVKSRATKTPMYNAKKKMMLHKYGITVQEV